jgi:hypothetical protein
VPLPDHNSAGHRLAAVAAWGITFAALVVTVAVSIVVVAAVGSRPREHTILEARLTTRTYLADGAGSQGAVTLWVDPARQRARMHISGAASDLYYLRSPDGAWVSVGRSGPDRPWVRARLAVSQVPSLLDLAGIRATFEHLRAASRAAVPVDMHHHLAFAFTAPAVPWPFRSSGPVTIWLDGATGLPLQFRVQLGAGRTAAVALTTVDELLMVSSTTRPPDFFTPPDQPPSAWDALLGQVRAWL